MIAVKQKFFDTIAVNWHENHQFSEEDEEKIKKVLSSVKFSKLDFILDLGAGTGRLSEFLTGRYTVPLKFFISDISGEMLKEGKKRLKALGLYWIQSNSECLPFKAGAFNHILCFSCFPHFDDKEKVLEEAYRLLKKEGSFLIFHLRSREDLNRFHARKAFPVSKDFLPAQGEFQRWAEKINFSLKNFEDEKGYFLAHFVKN